MQLKDYYSILEVAPTATALQIKKSFRRLALQHHPDKNPGNATAGLRFKEIREAYETLSDAAKREEYNYKRWYSRSLHQSFRNEPLDPAAILLECKHLDNYLQSANAFRINYDGLSIHIRQLLNQNNIAILQQFNDETANAAIVKSILHAADALPHKYILPITNLLFSIAGSNTALTEMIHAFIKLHNQKTYWEKYKVVIVILITLLLCWVIYEMA